VQGCVFKALLRSVWTSPKKNPLNPPRPLSIAKILLGAFILPWWHRRTLFRALAAPGIALVSIDVVWFAFAKSLSPAVYSAASWVLWIVPTLLWLVFAVTVHRIILLQIRDNELPTFPEWGRRETLFLGWAVAIYALATALAFVAGIALMTLVGNVFSGSFAEFAFPYMAAVVMTYFLGRTSIVLPATAIDRRITLAEAWSLTRGNALRMMAIVGVLPWSFSYLWDVLYRQDPSMIVTVLVTAIATVFMTVEIAALSLAYRELSAGQAESNGAPPGDITSSGQ
jgi:hypothetical protein